MEEYQRKRAAHRRLVVNRWKRRKGCVDCGYKSNYNALELDHLFGKKDNYRTVASLMYASWRIIKEEIAKCEVVCCNCHAIRTRSRDKRFARVAEWHTQGT